MKITLEGSEYTVEFNPYQTGANGKTAHGMLQINGTSYVASKLNVASGIIYTCEGFNAATVEELSTKIIKEKGL